MKMVKYVVEKHCFYGACYQCSIIFNDEDIKIYGFPEVIERKDFSTVKIYRCCKQCFDNDLAITEAKEESRRFTFVGTYPLGYRTEDKYIGGNYIGDERCLCGSVSLMNSKNIKINNACIKCSILHSRLGKMEAEKKIMSNMLRELRREIKTQTQLIGN
jgi:hypothetical protein